MLKISRAHVSMAIRLLFTASLLTPSQVFAAEIDPKISGVLSPAAQDDGWPVGSVAAAGFNEEAMVQLATALSRDEYSNVHAVLVEHSGKLVFEQYLSGTDSHWGRATGPVQFDRGTLHDLRSVTKSVTSLLLGIALKDGYGKALDRPVVDYLPGGKAELDPRKRHISLRHVLTMTAGLEWNEMTVPYSSGDNDENKLYSSDDPAEFVLSLPVREAAGERWYYNGGLTMVVAKVVEKVSGDFFVQYAHDALFTPLGITAFKWYGPRTWRTEGMPSAASGLRLRARDLAKIGSVVLNDGQWLGRQIVPKKWIKLSTQRRRNDTAPWDAEGTYGYGHHWWHGRFRAGDTPFFAITAMGHGGQRVFVLPEQKLVVTIFSGNYHSNDWWKSERILKRIVAAVR